MLTKTTFKILQVFTGHIAEPFTLREVARKLDMHVSLTHRALQPLLKLNIIQQDKHKRLSLNHKHNHEILAFAEYLRKEERLKKFSDLKLLTDDVKSKINEDSFVLILFGSAVISSRPRDFDILLIVDNITKVEFHERLMGNIADYYKDIHKLVISFESVYEMLKKREQINVMNEILNKHIILHGAELFYRLLEGGRQRLKKKS